MRNNVERSVINKGKQWDKIPFWDIIMGDFKMKVFGSKVFSSLWSAWTQVREFISYKNATEVLLSILLLTSQSGGDYIGIISLLFLLRVVQLKNGMRKVSLLLVI